MTGAQFLNAVALGQITPGPSSKPSPSSATPPAGVGGGLLAAFVAFTPSFLFVIGGAAHFDRLRPSRSVQRFLTGAGAAVIGAIAGSSIPLGLALGHLWQLGVLVLAAVWLLVLKRATVTALVGAGALGIAVALAGGPVPH